MTVDNSSDHKSSKSLWAATAVTALVAQVWDTLINFTDEVEYLWRGKFNRIKALYFVMRYMMLIAHIMSQILSHHLRQIKSPSRLCPVIFMYKTIVPSMSLMMVEIILLIRVYALFNQSKRAKYFLLSIFFISATLEMTGLALVVASHTEATDCVVVKPNHTYMTIYAVGAGTSQSVILSGTIFKYVTRRKSGWTRTPLTSLMLREGIWAFFGVIALVLVSMLYEAHRIRLSQSELPDFSEAGLAWYIAFLSMAGSRLILNMRKVFVTNHLQHQSSEESESSDSICLTSIMD
ncbi:hypothetical protein D9613_010453 [Agrocybe pediades]|uniref:DUF6533 domain-containing protein n=1 Tax=Agrocybe pediades TaxID=84607 RepID=A0A8H4QGK0_9AGAR|nr:hypothetical protein D9613_010453 [Agrocybe pediades]